MKKVLILLISCFLIMLSTPANAEDSDSSSSDMGDLMQYSDRFDNPYAGQKQISDEDFQKTLDQVKAKQGKKKKQPPTFKGKNYNGSNTTNYINETGEKNILLGVPLDLINGDGTEIPIGHYKVIAKRENDKVYLNFLQSSTLVAKVPAIETDSDFDEKELNFVKLESYDDKRIRIIYGSMDLNAYTFINIKK